MEPPLSITDRARRRFLITNLAGLLIGIGPCGHCLGSEKKDPPHEPPWWLRLSGDRDAVLRFGNAYLRSHPEERKFEILVARIEKAISTDSDLETAVTRQAACAAMLQHKVREDYRRGELVSVNSWLLSRTEARMYAAAAIFFQTGGSKAE